jgi:hypothetical protein
MWSHLKEAFTGAHIAFSRGTYSLLKRHSEPFQEALTNALKEALTEALTHRLLKRHIEAVQRGT